MELKLLVEDYDLILNDVKRQYPDASIDTQHAIALQLDNKLNESRKGYAETYRDLYMDKNSDSNESFENILQANRAYMLK